MIFGVSFNFGTVTAYSDFSKHCHNWTVKDAQFCQNCFWAHPENYSHIAGKEERQIIITFTDNEIDDYNHLISIVGQEQAENKIKELISEYIKED